MGIGGKGSSGIVLYLLRKQILEKRILAKGADNIPICKMVNMELVKWEYRKQKTEYRKQNTENRKENWELRVYPCDFPVPFPFVIPPCRSTVQGPPGNSPRSSFGINETAGEEKCKVPRGPRQKEQAENNKNNKKKNVYGIQYFVRRKIYIADIENTSVSKRIVFAVWEDVSVCRFFEFAVGANCRISCVRNIAVVVGECSDR